MAIKIIHGHEIDEKYLYPKAKRIEFDRGLSWKKIETPNNEPSYVVNHFTCSYELEGTVGYFQSEGVSVHFVVGKKGEVVQMAPANMRCAHAGASQWDSNKDGVIQDIEQDLNRFSLGIEVVCLGPLSKRGDKYYDCWNREYKGTVREKEELGFKYWEPWTPEQEKAVEEICTWAIETFGIKPRNIVDHAEVAPRRKNDPGGSSQLTGEEYRKYITTRISSNPQPEPIDERKHYIFQSAESLMKNYKDVGMKDKMYLRVKHYGKCVICEKEIPDSENMVCGNCHKKYSDKIIVI